MYTAILAKMGYQSASHACKIIYCLLLKNASQAIKTVFLIMWFGGKTII